MRRLRLTRRSEMKICRFSIFFLFGYLFGMCVVEESKYLDAFRRFVDPVCNRPSAADSGATRSYRSVFIGIPLHRGDLNEQRLDALADQLRTLADFNCGLFTCARRNHNLDILSRKYGIKIIYLGNCQSWELDTNAFYNMIKDILRIEFISYDWLVVLHENSYVNSQNLHELLSRTNSSKPFYIGRASWKSKGSAQSSTGYCMGRPGFILSKGLLLRVNGHLHECSEMSYSNRYDLELGRCIKTFANVACKELEDNRLLSASDDMREAIQIQAERAKFPNTDASHLDRGTLFLKFHLQTLSEEISTVIDSIVEKETEIKASWYKEKGKELDLARVNSRGDMIWQFSDWTESSKFHNIPLNHPELYEAVEENLKNVGNEIQKRYGILRQASIKDMSALESTYAVNPLASFDIRAKIHVTGKLRGQSMAIRLRNLHFQKLFANTFTFLREEHNLTLNPPLFSKYEIRRNVSSERVNFIVPVRGKLDSLHTFLNNFRIEFCESNMNVSLTVVYFAAVKSSEVDNLVGANEGIRAMQDAVTLQAKEMLDKMKNGCPQQKVSIIPISNNKEKFSRGLALQIGAERTKNKDSADELLFFCDVDIALKREILLHICRNTVQGHQVFYPVFYSQYDPSHISGADEINKHTMRKESLAARWTAPFFLHELSGFWRTLTYSTVSLYKSDFMRTEGFDLSSRGWGIEDDKFCNAVLKKAKLQIFRSNEPNLFHGYHDKYCSASISQKQYQRCRQSRTEQSRSLISLYKLWNKRSNARGRQ